MALPIKESTLGTVPRASRLGREECGATDAAVPSGHAPNMDSCIEPTPRPALAYGLRPGGV